MQEFVIYWEFEGFREMGSSKEGRGSRIRRGVKTLFFLTAMLLSLLLCAPVLLVIADAILPSALLSASLSSQTVYSHFSNYDFRYSLIDVPLISIVRSAIILCVYSICDGPSLSRGPYLGIAMACSISSLVFVSVKASFVFGEQRGSDVVVGRDDRARAMEMAMFVSSLILAVGHIVAAYRTSCRERRKLLVFKIDIEAVSSACKNGFPKYHKMILQEDNMKAAKGKL